MRIKNQLRGSDQAAAYRDRRIVLCRKSPLRRGDTRPCQQRGWRLPHPETSISCGSPMSHMENTGFTLDSLACSELCGYRRI